MNQTWDRNDATRHNKKDEGKKYDKLRNDETGPRERGQQGGKGWQTNRKLIKRKPEDENKHDRRTEITDKEREPGRGGGQEWHTDWEINSKHNRTQGKAVHQMAGWIMWRERLPRGWKRTYENVWGRLIPDLFILVDRRHESCWWLWTIFIRSQQVYKRLVFEKSPTERMRV